MGRQESAAGARSRGRETIRHSLPADRQGISLQQLQSTQLPAAWVERTEWTGTTTSVAVTAQGTLMWDVQNPMVGSTADPPSSLLSDVPHLSLSTGKV